MKKLLPVITIFITILFISVIGFQKRVYADNIITKEQSQLLQIKENQVKTLEEYKQKYGSDAYGLTAYILHMVQVYSIPVCFLGIVISLIYRFVLGIKNIEFAEKSLVMIVGIVTLTIICQVLPLVFAVVVKLGEE